MKVSSVLVGDPTKEYFKLTFWRKAAEWVNTIKEGDMLVVKELKIEKWNEEFYGQTTFRTTLVNFQRNSTCKVPAQWLTIVNHGEVKSLLKWLKEKHSYLMVNKTASCEDVEWKTLKQFVPNTLVHYRAKIVKVLTYGNTRNKYEFEKRQVNKIVAGRYDAISTSRSSQTVSDALNKRARVSDDCKKLPFLFPAMKFCYVESD